MISISEPGGLGQVDAAGLRAEPEEPPGSTEPLFAQALLALQVLPDVSLGPSDGRLASQHQPPAKRVTPVISLTASGSLRACVCVCVCVCV